MDFSKEKTLNRIDDEDRLGPEPNPQKVESSDPLDGLRDLLIDALAGNPPKKPPADEKSDLKSPPTQDATPPADEKSDLKSPQTQEETPPVEPSHRSKKSAIFSQQSLSKKRQKPVSSNRGWKTISVKHERIEERGQNSEINGDRVGERPRSSGGSREEIATAEPSQPPSHTQEMELLTPPPEPSPTTVSETKTAPTEAESVAVQSPAGETSSPPILDEIAETNRSLQENADAVLTGIEQLETLLVEETKQIEKQEKTGSTVKGSDEEAVESLQQLLFGSKLSEVDRVATLLKEYDLPLFRELLGKIDTDLQALEHQIYDPQQLIELMKPWIAEILSRKIADSKDEVAKALVPIIDEVIKNRSKEDKTAMSAAISSVLPSAIAQQIKDSPEDIAKAIAPEMAVAIKEQIRLDRNAIANVLAPEMGRTIKEQIRLERDAMVDALYPVIGNTISKYMAEAIQTINQKVANALSIEGVQRKVRAKVQGVSEAELILKEAMPFVAQAIFLIHKASGLVIAEVQQTGNHRLESEMVAGMLTAIRSFVNDCIVQPGEFSELNEVEYGDSKIILEVAGYCYLAAVVKGDPPKKFIEKMRQCMTSLVLDYGDTIQEFDGDPANIPDAIHNLIEGLMESSVKKPPEKPYALIGVSLAILGLILVPWGIWQYQSGVNRRLEEKVAIALNSAPELAVYRLDVKAKRNGVILSGKLPNRELRQQAAEIATTAVGDRPVDNQIVAVKVPADPVLVAGEVMRVSAVLNQMDGVSVVAEYGNEKVTLNGTVMERSQVEKIVQAIEGIPGVESVVSTLKLDPLEIRSRIYFESGSVRVNSGYEETLANLKLFLEQYPEKNIRIVGHSDRTGNVAKNQKLALERAQAVRDALVKQGADPKRLEAIGNGTPPKDIESNQPNLLGRVVIFEPITPGNSNP